MYSNYPKAPQRLPSLEERCRGGSLPLKKRRFMLDNNQVLTSSAFRVCDASTAAAAWESPEIRQVEEKPRGSAACMPEHKAASLVADSIYQLPSMGRQEEISPRLDNSDQKFAALALVASTADYSYSRQASTSTQSRLPTLLSVLQNHQSPVINDGDARTRTPENMDEITAASASALLQLDPMHFNTGYPDSGNTSSSSDDSSVNVPVQISRSPLKKRTKHRWQHLASAVPEDMAELASPTSPRPTISTGPVPGGCHGITSRTHSCCKRLPLYKGSNFCKLHFHQVKKGGEANPNTIGDATPTPKKSIMATSSTNATDGNKGQNSSFPPSQNPQDRRYTGKQNAQGVVEQRCLATTTRGRECAYVAVGCTQYCHLHADYDIHPPPRRGGSLASPSPQKGKAIVVVPGTSISGNNKRGRPKTSVKACKSARTAHSKSPSSQSGKMGTKAGSENMHNYRRSSSSSIRISVSSQSSAQTTRVSGISKSAKLAKKHADSPFPLLSMISTDQWQDKLVRVAVGPMEGRSATVEKWSNGWVSVRIPGVGLHNRRSFELYLVQNEKEDADLEQVRYAKIVEGSKKDLSLLRCVSREMASPSPGSGFAVAAKKHNGGSQYPIKIPATPSSTTELIDVPKTPVPFGNILDASITTASRIFVPKVTPTVTALAKNVPLVESLLMAEGEGKGGRFDLLFGTAALERSRRIVRKPTLYEPDSLNGNHKTAASLHPREGGTPH